MNRQEKTLVVDGLKKDLLSSKASFLAVYKGLNVAKMQQLRSGLRAKGGSLKVAKARLMKRAIEDESGMEGLSGFLKDQVCLVFAEKEINDVAKVLFDFSKENEALQLVVGFFDSKIMPREKIVQMASLPSREVMLAQLCGTLKGALSKLVMVLKQIEHQKEGK